MKNTKPDYPVWICFECGERYGNKHAGVCTVHTDTCGICKRRVPCTEPRDFGHLKHGWEEFVK